MNGLNTATTLRTVFEGHYLTRQLVNPRPNTLRCWRRQLKWFDVALGRAATVADLTPQTLATAERSLRDNSLRTDNQISVFHGHVIALWRYLDDEGVIHNAPLRPNRHPRKRLAGAVDQPRNSLHDAFEVQFLKAKGSSLKSWEPAQFRWAVRRISLHLGRQATIDDLTEETVTAVMDALPVGGVTAGSVARFRKRVVELWSYLATAGIVSTRPIDYGRPVDLADGTKLANWGRRGNKTMARGAARKRLITTPQVSVEQLKLTDRLTDLANAYIARKLRGSSPQTKYKYGRMIISELEFFLDRPATIGDLFSNENIEGVVWQLIENGREVASALTYAYKFCALWRWASDRGLTRVRPDVELPVAPKRVPVGWDRGQLATLFRACAEQQGQIAGVSAADWLLSLHCALWDSGERISAMLSARFENLSSDGWLKIEAESRKGQREEKTCLLHADTLALIDRIRKPDRELIFPWPFSQCTLWNRYKTMLRRAGLPCDRRHMFHAVRKTASSFVRAAGLSATEFLGHADEETTRAYMIPSIVGQRQASEVLFRPYRGKATALIGVEPLAELEGSRGVT